MEGAGGCRAAGVLHFFVVEILDLNISVQSKAPTNRPHQAP